MNTIFQVSIIDDLTNLLFRALIFEGGGRTAKGVCIALSSNIPDVDVATSAADPPSDDDMADIADDSSDESGGDSEYSAPKRNRKVSLLIDRYLSPKLIVSISVRLIVITDLKARESAVLQKSARPDALRRPQKRKDRLRVKTSTMIRSRYLVLSFWCLVGYELTLIRFTAPPSSNNEGSSTQGVKTSSPQLHFPLINFLCSILM